MKTVGKPLVNRCFVPPPVYIGFTLFVLAKRRSEQLFTIPWRARGTVGFWADRNVGTLFCPASPRPAVRRAPRRPDLPVVCPGFGFDRFNKLPLFVLAKRHSEQLFIIPWEIRGTVGSQADRNDGILFCPVS